MRLTAKQRRRAQMEKPCGTAARHQKSKRCGQLADMTKESPLFSRRTAVNCWVAGPRAQDGGSLWQRAINGRPFFHLGCRDRYGISTRRRPTNSVVTQDTVEEIAQRVIQAQKHQQPVPSALRSGHTPGFLSLLYMLSRSSTVKKKKKKIQQTEHFIWLGN